MRKFFQRALDKLPRLDKEQIHSLIYDLAFENDLMEVVLESMTDGVIVVDENNKLRLFNKSAERLLYLDLNDKFEKLLWEIIPDENVSSFIKTSLEAKDNINDIEFLLINNDQSRIVSLTLMPLVKKGVIQGSIFHIEDVTNKKYNQAKLKRAESLASLTTLAAGVAHEIKNPLASIGIHIQLMQKSLNNDNYIKDDFSSCLNIINEEVDRLNSIVVDFLFSVRPISLSMLKQNFNNFLGDFIKFIKPELSRENISLETEIKQDTPFFEFDEKYIKQALLNIVKNSISAMPDGGNIHIKTFTENNKFILEISDTGNGISDEIKEKIFEPYFTTKEFGSGLGLTMVYKIIKEHLGEITFETSSELGTKFIISLPLPQAEKKLLDFKE